MAYIRVIDEDEADGKLFEIYDEIQRNRGRVANILRVSSLEPKSMRAHLDLYMSTVFGKGGLSRRESEVIAVAVSAANGDPYCTTHHREALARYAKDPLFVEAVAKDTTTPQLTAREKALVDYARNLTRHPEKGVQKHVEALRKAGLRDEEILQAAQVVGYFNFANRLAIGLGVELEPDADRDYHY
ncbi:MAG: peroxidase-related enzyme [Thermoplasmatota archaeon]